MKQNWEEQIKNNLGDYKKLPERDLWPEIERKLDKGNKKRPLIIPLWGKAGAIVATAASLALIIFLNPAQDAEDISLALNTEKLVPDSAPFSDPNKINETGEPTAEFLVDNTQKNSSNSSLSSHTTINGSLTTEGSADTNTNLAREKETTDEARAELTDVAVDAQPNRDPAATRTIIAKGSTVTTTTTAAVSSETTIAATTTPVAKETKATGASTNIAIGDQKENNPAEIIEKLQGPVTSLVADQDVTAPLKDESENQAWSIMPVAGPVYYNSLSQGSVFDPSLSDNARQGDITFSYGLRINLDFDERITLRAGINSVAMGYATQDIEIATGPAAFGLSSVNYNDNKNIISVFDKGTVPANPDPSNPYSQLNLKSTTGETTLRANLNYLEFPVELSYALIDQQVKLSLISGVSGLLLNNNEVSVNDGQNRYVLGRLNNLNQFSFSTNIGFGLSYNVFNGFNLQIEPTFKYQLGAYKDASVEFTPYQLVLLSGVQFQF